MTLLPCLAIVSGLAAVGAAVAAAGCLFAVRGSTAAPAALWAIVACLACAFEMGVRAGGGLVDPSTSASARLAVAAIGLCPAMSLLGAKRPQHGVWQLIVATLAAVLALPALTALLVRPGSLPDVHILQRGFMLLLLLVGWLNFAGTQRGLAATLIVIGQLAIVWPFLPAVSLAEALPQQIVDAIGCSLILVGAVLAQCAKKATPVGTVPLTGGAAIVSLIDPPFLALRETLGAAWALRIAERFDAVATTRGWPCRLRFSGLAAGGDPTDTSWHRDAHRAFTALMRRFVNQDWLTRHRQA